MYCKNCGKEIDEKSVVCPHCGCATYNNKTIPSEYDTGSIGWGVLGFLFPLIGLILYLVWKDNKPITAHVAGKGALIGFIISVVVAVLSVAFVSCIAAAALGTLV